MVQTVSVIVSTEDRARLTAIIGDCGRPLKHVQRARIVVHQSDCQCWRWAWRSGDSRPAVWRWQRHFAQGGVDRLLRDGTRKAGKPRTPPATVAKVVAQNYSEPPGEVTHWTGRAMAQATGLSLRTVQRIWVFTSCSRTACAP